MTDALAQSKQLAADKMAAVTGGMGLPGIGGLPGLR
jgi:DNA-binding protein YbaB